MRKIILILVSLLNLNSYSSERELICLKYVRAPYLSLSDEIFTQMNMKQLASVDNLNTGIVFNIHIPVCNNWVSIVQSEDLEAIKKLAQNDNNFLRNIYIKDSQSGRNAFEQLEYLMKSNDETAMKERYFAVLNFLREYEMCLMMDDSR